MNNLNKNIYIVFDSDCVLCNNFIKLIDNNYDDKSSKLFLVSDVGFLREYLQDYLQLKFLESLQKKTIIVILSKKEFLLRSKAISYILSICNNNFLNLIGVIINITPLFISDFIYDFISTYRKRFLKSNKCTLYYPKNIKLFK